MRVIEGIAARAAIQCASMRRTHVEEVRGAAADQSLHPAQIQSIAADQVTLAAIDLKGSRSVQALQAIDPSGTDKAIDAAKADAEDAVAAGKAQSIDRVQSAVEGSGCPREIEHVTAAAAIEFLERGKAQAASLRGVSAAGDISKSKAAVAGKPIQGIAAARAADRTDVVEARTEPGDGTSEPGQTAETAQGYSLCHAGTAEVQGIHPAAAIETAAGGGIGILIEDIVPGAADEALDAQASVSDRIGAIASTQVCTLRDGHGQGRGAEVEGIQARTVENNIAAPAIAEAVGIVAVAAVQSIVAAQASDTVAAVIAAQIIRISGTSDIFDRAQATVRAAVQSGCRTTDEVNHHSAVEAAVIDFIAARAAVDGGSNAAAAHEGKDVRGTAAEQAIKGREDQTVAAAGVSAAIGLIDGEDCVSVDAVQFIRGESCSDDTVDAAEARAQAGFAAGKSVAAGQPGQLDVAQRSVKLVIEGIAAQPTIDAAGQGYRIIEDKGVVGATADQGIDVRVIKRAALGRVLALDRAVHQIPQTITVEPLQRIEAAAIASEQEVEILEAVGHAGDCPIEAIRRAQASQTEGRSAGISRVIELIVTRAAIGITGEDGIIADIEEVVIRQAVEVAGMVAAHVEGIDQSAAVEVFDVVEFQDTAVGHVGVGIHPIDHVVHRQRVPSVQAIDRSAAQNLLDVEGTAAEAGLGHVEVIGHAQDRGQEEVTSAGVEAVIESIEIALPIEEADQAGTIQHTQGIVARAGIDLGTLSAARDHIYILHPGAVQRLEIGEGQDAAGAIYCVGINRSRYRPGTLQAQPGQRIFLRGTQDVFDVVETGRSVAVAAGVTIQAAQSGEDDVASAGDARVVEGITAQTAVEGAIESQPIMEDEAVFAAAANKVFDGGKECGYLIAALADRDRIVQIEGQIASRRRKVKGVIAGTIHYGIDTIVIAEHVAVGTTLAIERIIALAAGDDVAAVCAGQRIIPITADQILDGAVEGQGQVGVDDLGHTRLGKIEDHRIAVGQLKGNRIDAPGVIDRHRVQLCIGIEDVLIVAALAIDNVAARAVDREDIIVIVTIERGGTCGRTDHVFDTCDTIDHACRHTAY